MNILYIDENQRQLADISFDKRIKIALARVLSSYSREDIFEYGVEKTEELKLMAIQLKRVNIENQSSSRFLERCDGTTKRHGSSARNLPPGEISLGGLDATISGFLGGIGEYSIADLERLFRQVDTSKCGALQTRSFFLFYAFLQRCVLLTADTAIGARALQYVVA